MANHSKRNRLFSISALMLLLTMITSSCKKDLVLGADPYKGGKEPLGVKFLENDTDNDPGIQGGEYNFRIRGLLNYKDKFEFFLNEQKAEVLSLTDSTIRVKIPEYASSGGATVVLEGQTFFGPNLTIEGKVNIDPTFKATIGSDYSIYDMFKMPSNDYILVGAFTNYENKNVNRGINRIAKINALGEFVADFSAKKKAINVGADGGLLSINPLSGGKFIVTGRFNTFDGWKGINNITRINADGKLDSSVVQLINPTPDIPSKGQDTVATFNGGVDGRILNSFMKDNKIIVVGDFKNYYRNYYEGSTKGNTVTDVTKMAQVLRMNDDGSLDLSYNYNPGTKQSNAGGNGNINGAFMQADGKIILVGEFSTFNGETVNRIARINTDGTLDKSFNSGLGADNAILSMSYNSVTQKIMIAGRFSSYNGNPRSGVAMLNADGSLNDVFKFGVLAGGFANFATQLSTGKIIVSGGFNNYNGILRQGFMFLNPDGSLAAGYNNTGAFQGQINKVTETTTVAGTPALILVGSISKFDNKKVGNIVRISVKK
ncbi:DUF5008 domain-containing protein [Pedobacter gandavensis]|uniref:DUF5008 domain-containing protein n=1 Tax=Pedobacter gandavensis TaxID=2679963 RepID=A0ABR6EXL8_9SPHI|nr:DUF5008 domain-containing protein [Pedobacter gandavensis]MBB2150033.1 DUF5008 domain-containing protein [Pedobacter gandavensis]